MHPAIRQTKATRETVRSLSARSTWCWECGSLVAPSFRWDWELSLSFPVCEMGPASLPALTLPDPSVYGSGDTTWKFCPQPWLPPRREGTNTAGTAGVSVRDSCFP